MTAQAPREPSLPTTSRRSLRPLELPAEESLLSESKRTPKRKLSQKATFFGLSIGGYLSPWPNYTSGQTILHNRKPCSKDWQLQKGARQQKPLGITKPRYLEQLENYLRKELLLLDLSSDSAEELRLQPYREIFEFFIEDFKTYKPLLSSIKNAYEEMLARQREKIRSLEPLKAKLVTVSEDCSEQILAMRAEEKSEISVLKKEKMELLKLIDKKNEEKVSLQTEVFKLRKNLAEEYLRYLSERDARKILLADLNELRYQREDMSLAQAPGAWGEDPVKLTMALKMARQDLTRTQMELNTMKANFGDVVPRRDFEMQEKINKDLQEQLDSLQSDYEEVCKEHEILLQLHMGTLKERDQFHSELQEIQRTSTPRPDWTKCEDVVSGGLPRWLILAEGKNSDQLVDVLLEEIGEGLLQQRAFFQGLGYGSDVPSCLRFDGEVENKKSSRKEVLALIRDLWKARLTEEKRESFSDFVFSFLEQRFETSEAMAWAYTIYEHAKLSRTNEVMSQFYAILVGKSSENVYLRHLEAIAQLQKEMTSTDHQDEGMLTMEQLSSILKTTFPLKKEEKIQELMETAGWNPKIDAADLFKYSILFTEDEEGQSTPFVQKIWAQYVNEKEEYLEELKHELGLELTSAVTPTRVREALMNIDPCLERQALDSCVNQVFQISAAETAESDEKEEKQISVSSALEQLRAIDIVRAGHREQDPTVKATGGSSFNANP